MAETHPTYGLYVGIDVAAETFTAAWLAPGGAPTVPLTCEQTPTGYAGVQRRLLATGVAAAATLLVMEATGNYWVAAAVAFHEAGYQVAVVNPLQAHHFAKAQLRRAKTDALDARDLAQLAAALRPLPWTPPPAVYHEVRQRLVARDALLAMRQQLRNQRHALLQWPVVVEGVRQHLDELIADLTRRIASFDAEIAATLKESVWAEALACLTSAPGIGLVTAAWLLVSTLNFTLCASPTALAAYAGLVPIPPRVGAQRAQSAQHRPRRQRSPPHGLLHGHAQRRAAQSGDQVLLRPPARGRQAAQGRPLRRRPQVAPSSLGARHQAPTLRSRSTTPRRLARARRLTGTPQASPTAGRGA